MLGVVSILLYSCTTISGSWDGVESLSEDQPLILTPFIENGEASKARDQSEVDPSLFAGVKSYAGYFTVNKRAQWNLYSWFFPAPDRPLNSTPLIIWLQGGPGHSSLYSLFQEIGPLQYEYYNKVLKSNFTWGSDYSLLFIDNPVGVGFSYSESGEYATTIDEVGQCLLNLLLQFLEVFPELKTAPLFIAGQSYGGRYVTSFGRYIHRNNMDPEKKKINLKGLAIGNGWIDPPTLLHHSELGLQLGLLDKTQADMINYMEKLARMYWADGKFELYEKAAKAGMDMLHAFAPTNLRNILVSEQLEAEDIKNFENYLNRRDIQRALHVKRMDYSYFNPIIERELKKESYRTSKPWLEVLLDYYGVMCYNGQLDIEIGYALSKHTYRSLNWTGVQAYRDAKRVPLLNPDNGALNSCIKEGGNFMDVMVRGAGHMVPKDKPRAAKQIIDIFINKFK